MIKRLPLLITIISIAFFVIFFSWFNLGRHAKTNSGRFDLGNVEQVLWNVTHGHGFTMTDPYGTAQVSRLMFHADVFLLVLTPFYAILPRSETLLLLQVLVVASGAIAVFLIARKVLGRDWWGAVFSVVYLLNPGLNWATMFDVHAVTFAAPIMLWAVWYALQHRYGWSITLLILAMLTKEEVGLTLIALGLYVRFWQHQKRWGWWLIGIPLVWSLAMFFIVLPLFQSAGSAQVYRTVFGTGAMAVVTGAISHPITFLQNIFAHHNLVYLWQMFSATGFISFLNPWWLAALPELIINMLSLKPAQHLIISHYSSAIVPWLIISSISGTWWVVQKMSLRWGNSVVESSLLIWLLGWLAYAAWTTGPLPFTRNDQTRFVTWRNSYATTIREWSKLIPTEAAVSVTNNVGAHFSKRQYLYSFPLGVAEAEYIVVLEHHATPVVATDDEVTAQIKILHQDPTWKILIRQDDLTILQRQP